MPAWKILLVMLFAAICFGLTLATIIVPLTLSESEGRWVWFGGLLAGTIVMGTLFTLFLRSQDRKFR
jgi:hypothetical protein